MAISAKEQEIAAVGISVAVGCKSYEEPVLITDRVNDSPPESSRFVTRFLGKVTLRGQSQEVGVFGVDSRSTPPGPSSGP